MRTPARLARELTAQLDGPHADGHTAAASLLCAETVRFLNYATGRHATDGLACPSTVYVVAADLSSAAYRMIQLSGQLGTWLAAELAAGRLGTGDGSPPGAAVAAAAVNLASAATAARHLSAHLSGLQNAVSGLHGRGPDRMEGGA
jgi:hypothetical protein